MPTNASELLELGRWRQHQAKVAHKWVLAVPVGRSQRAGQTQCGVGQARTEGGCIGHSESGVPSRNGS